MEYEQYDAFGTPIETSTEKYGGYQSPSNNAVDGSSLGVVGTGLSLITGIANAWNAHENNKIAKETLAFNKEQYAKSYDNFLADRERRIARQNSLQDSVNAANGVKDDRHWRTGANPAGQGHDTIGADGTNYSTMSDEERYKRPAKKAKRKLVDSNAGSTPNKSSNDAQKKTGSKIQLASVSKPKTKSKQLNKKRVL